MKREGSAPTTHEKARRINLANDRYGTFAEIGAGQEVARWFFHVGGAAGTVAKSISAYDMTVSDAVYGPTDRYVSRKRLLAMLDHEWELLIERLGERRHATAFFVFADTMATRSFKHPQDGDGWMGMRFQHQPGAAPSEIMIHVRMFDTENAREQEAIGIVGVNLIYGAIYHGDDPETLIGSLIEDLSQDRIEIDAIKFSGPRFADVDNRLLSLQLVEQQFTDAVMFDAAGEVMQPAEILYKRPVLIQRGSFRPVTRLVLEMLERAHERFCRKHPARSSDTVAVMEMTLRNIFQQDRLDHEDFLARVDTLAALDKSVMVSRFGPFYPVSAYLRRFTSEPLGYVLGTPALTELVDERYYEELPGGLLESLGRLFNGDVTLYVCPSRDSESQRIVTLEDLELPPALRPLYRYLVDGGAIEPIREIDESQLHVFPDDVRRMIGSGDARWKDSVPEPAVSIIEKRGLFGHSRS